MKRIRLSTLLLLIVIVAQGLALYRQSQALARAEAEVVRTKVLAAQDAAQADARETMLRLAIVSSERRRITELAEAKANRRVSASDVRRAVQQVR